MTTERKIFLAGFTVLLVIIVWMFMRVENLEKEMTSQYQSQQEQRKLDNYYDYQRRSEIAIDACKKTAKSLRDKVSCGYFE